MLTIDKVYHAQKALKGVARKTDVIYAPKLCPGTELYLKTENLQITGSFKLRGAYYKMTCLSKEEKARGVIACSAGNHAQGVALAAQKNGIKAVICLPANAPICLQPRCVAPLPEAADRSCCGGIYYADPATFGTAHRLCRFRHRWSPVR